MSATIASNAAEPKQVLLLNSFGNDFAPFNDVTRSFRAELVSRSRETINFYEASIYSARLQAPVERGSLVKYLHDLFPTGRPDLIVTFGAPALYFARGQGPRPFPNVPILIAGIDERRIPAGTLTDNDAVVGVRLDLPAFVENILRVRPETTNIAVIVGDTPNERYWVSEMRRQFQPFASRVEFTWLSDLPLDKMLQQIGRLTPRSAIFYFMLAVDAGGAAYPQDAAFSRIRAAAKVPIFGFGDYHMGQGVVGGPLTQTRALGRKTAGVALHILGGEAPGGIKTAPLGFGTPMYDWRELRRWGISEGRLPLGAVVSFREPSAWEQYRWQIALVTALLVIQSAFIVALIHQRHLRQRAEVVVRQRMSELAHMGRRGVAGELSASIAHEINQPLAAIVTNSNAGLRWLTNKVPNLEETAAALKRIASEGHRASQVIATIREMLRKDVEKRTVLDANDVVREVLSLLKTELQKHRISVKTDLIKQIPAVSANRVQLQQVILNLCMNAVEAMDSVIDRARVLQVRSGLRTPAGVLITIEDSGIGIDPKNIDRIFEAFFTTKLNGMGMGLSICRSIVEDHGGRLLASRGRLHGSVFQVSLPPCRDSADRPQP
jgi:signal transduction histidine kinase